MKRNIFLTLGLMFFTASSYAVHPFSTSDASVVAVKSVEYQIDVNFGPNGTNLLYSAGTGVTEILSAVISYTDYAGPEYVSGGPLNFSVNLMLFSAEGMPSIALINGFSPGSGDYSAVLAATHQIENLTIHLSAGYEFPVEDTPAGIAAELSLFEGLSVLGEVYADSLIKMQGEGSLLAGLRKVFNDNYSMSFGAVYGAKESMNVSYTLAFTAVL